jgi:hypothetical protein
MVDLRLRHKYLGSVAHLTATNAVKFQHNCVVILIVHWGSGARFVKLIWREILHSRKGCVAHISGFDAPRLRHSNRNAIPYVFALRRKQICRRERKANYVGLIYEYALSKIHRNANCFCRFRLSNNSKVEAEVEGISLSFIKFITLCSTQAYNAFLFLPVASHFIFADFIMYS